LLELMGLPPLAVMVVQVPLTAIVVRLLITLEVAGGLPTVGVLLVVGVLVEEVLVQQLHHLLLARQILVGVVVVRRELELHLEQQAVLAS